MKTSFCWIDEHLTRRYGAEVYPKRLGAVWGAMLSTNHILLLPLQAEVRSILEWVVYMGSIALQACEL